MADTLYYIDKIKYPSTGTTKYYLLDSGALHDSNHRLSGTNGNFETTGTIKAGTGIFNELIAVSLSAKNASIDELTAQNATVMGIMDVKGKLMTNSWEAASIANVGGSFYISPTGKDTGTPNVTITCNSVTNGAGTYTITVGKGSGSNQGNGFGVSSTSSSLWSVGSRVLMTGNVICGTKNYPLGSLDGLVTARTIGTNVITSITLNTITSSALDLIFTEQSTLAVNSSITGTSNGSNMQISLYQSKSGNYFYPIGILLSSYGQSDKQQYIDIYSGSVKLGYQEDGTTTLNTGMAEPSLRIGQLDGLPNIVDNGTSETLPTGWGIYTTNGFFKGKVVANAGLIATWNIGSTSIYSGTNSMTSTTQGTYIGTGTDATSGIRNYKDANTFVNISQGVITAKAVDLTGKITASSGSIGGWNIGTDTNKSLYYGNQTPGATTTNLVLSPTSATNSNAIGGSGTGLTWFMSAGRVFGVTTAGALYSTSGKIGGFDIGTTYLRNGNIASATNTSVAGVYLGTDGLNISNGTAATTSYITKTAVNIGNKLIWNGTTLTIDGSASIGGTTASTLISNAENGQSAYTGLSDKASISAEYSVEIITSNFNPTATSGNLVTLTAKVTRVDGNSVGTLTYKWYGDGTVISGATSATYNVPYNTTYNTFTVEIS